jgi:HlyD family secretion protein
LAKDKLQGIELDLIYYQQRQALTSQRQQQEEDIRQVQVKQLEESAEMLQKNLLFARNNLNNLLIKAPVSGYLSELNVELGESKSQGVRLGQIDIPNKFKLMVNVDEYYLNQIALAMNAQLFINGETVDIKVTKIDSRVRQAQFRIEFTLPTNIDHIKRGQSLELDLMLSKGIKNSLLVKRGAFVNSTGGNWAFVLNDDGTSAERSLIKLGKKNQNYLQILEGLTAGERVITSNYNAFNQADIIKITGHKS